MALAASAGGLLDVRPALADSTATSRTSDGPPAPADPTPLVDARFPCQIAPDVWLIPDRRVFLVPNIGIVVGRDSALIIDCGLGLENGKQVLEAARRVAPGRKLILTQTHAHPEHCFGAMAFKDQADVFLNRAQNDYLLKEGPPLLALFRSIMNEEVGRMLEGVEVVAATKTYDGDGASIDLGGRTVEFKNWGTAHSPGDQTIHLPQEKILFAGDLIEERMFPIVPFFPPTIPKTAIDTGRWVEALAHIEAAHLAMIVPGHGNLGGAEIARSVREYLQDVKRRTASKITRGSDDDAITELTPAIRADHATWEHPQFIEPAIRFFAAG